MIVKTILPRALERLATIEVGASVKKAVAQMAKPHTDLVVVSNQGEMAGVLTMTYIVGHMGRWVGAGCITHVDSVMTRDVTYCQAHEILLDIWSVMKERGLLRIPIIDAARRPIGIVYAREILQALLSEAENEDELLRDYISEVGYQ